MEFDYDGGGPGKGGDATLFIDGKQVGKGRVDATLAMVFSADDGLDVGRDTGAAVAEDYPPGNNAFNGKVRGVQLAIDDAAVAPEHQITVEQALALAMARQ
jgi:arylsulfatase